MSALNRSRSGYLLIMAVCILFLQTSCTRTETGSVVPAGRGGDMGDREDTGAVAELPGEEADVVAETATYDLEDEILEEDDIEETTEKMEEIKPVEADTFVVDDIVEAPETDAGFDIGYRVQLFATSDLERARELKKNVMAGTGLAVYIEYEGGLYKVRVGDFPGREEAATARTELVERYPDCWIVKTTIRK